MSINAKSTKAEIMAAYQDLEKTKKALELEIKKISQTNPIELNNNSTKNSKLDKNIELPKTAPKDMINIIQSLSQVQIGFGNAASILSEQLIAEATKLENLGKSIEQEREHLATLHDITKIDEETLDNLILTYQESTKKFSQELEQKQETSDRQIQESQQAWNKEKEIHLRERKETQEAYRKETEREEEEYQYNLDLVRDLDEEEYEQQKQNQQRELAEARQSIEKQWQETEETIAKQEREYAEIEEKVKTFEEKLKAKIKQGYEEGKAIGTYQAKIKADLRNKEIEGEKQNDRLRIESLEKTIQERASRIDKLSQQLDASLQQVQSLAVKAIEGSSNRNSFEAMKEIAIEQAKTAQKGK
jgi:hypothetical protein